MAVVQSCDKGRAGPGEVASGDNGPLCAGARRTKARWKLRPRRQRLGAAVRRGYDGPGIRARQWRGSGRGGNAGDCWLGSASARGKLRARRLSVVGGYAQRKCERNEGGGGGGGGGEGARQWRGSGGGGNTGDCWLGSASARGKLRARRLSVVGGYAQRKCERNGGGGGGGGEMPFYKGV